MRKQLTKKQLRKRRTSAKIRSAANRPRLSVFRSNKGIFLQIIDDREGKTLVSVSTKEVSDKANKSEAAKEAGMLLAKKAKEAGIDKVVFDRGQYKYHGRVKAVAEAAREGGLIF